MKILRKFISILLVGVIAFNECAPLVKAIDTYSTSEITESQNEKISKSEVTKTGNIEVETHFVMPIRNTEKTDITLSLYKGEDKITSVSISDFIDSTDVVNAATGGIRVSATRRDKEGKLLTGFDSNNNLVYFAANFYNLETGVYTIKLEGQNFVTYKSNISLEDFSKRVIITDEKGMFAIGDVNKDQVIDSKDVTNMLKAIKEKDLTHDLNLDGAVDIADLNYITANLNGDSKNVKIESTSAILSLENVDIEKSEDTNLINGELSDIFNEDGLVTLKQDGDKPIEVSLNFAKDNQSSLKIEQIRINFGEENIPEEAHLEIEDAQGEVLNFPIPKTTAENKIKDIHLFTEDETAMGARVIDLNGQIAVKKVKIVITKTGETNLADIAQVEFLNNVKVELKEPDDLYTPENIVVDDSVSEKITVTFNDVANVTGYEIRINGGEKNGVIFQTTFTNFTIEDLKNYVTYKIAVRAVNGEWASAWSKDIEATPKATRVPPAVDMVTATPVYGGIDFGWKKMDDTKSYNLYYREVGKDKWEKIAEEITTTKYSLRGLKPQTEYEAYLTGNNDLGEGSASQIVRAKTLEQTATIYPKYKLINNFNPVLNRTEHIEDVIYKIGESYTKNGNDTVSSDKWSMVDDNYLSYWQYSSWQINAHTKSMDAPLFVLDKEYEMDEFVITVPDSYVYSYKAVNPNDAVIDYWTDSNRTKENKITVQAKIQTKFDENKRKYYVLKLDKPIKTAALQVGLTVANNGPLIQIAEIKFYEYDSLVNDVAKLFVDDLRVELSKDATKERIDELRKRADEKNNGEYNPYRESIINDLDYAEKLLNDKTLNDIITLNPDISNSYNNHLGFAMTISDYQPLGVAVREGEQITIYVGSTGKVNVEAVFTQNYAEANAWNSKITLQKGQNVITVPKIGSASSERGGSLYVRYTSQPDKNNLIKVRVSGGTKIPMLDTTLTEGNEEKTKETIKNYINDLDKYVNNLPALYSKIYEGSEKSYSYERATSVLGVTEIVTRHGLWSFSSEAVRDAINNNLTSIDDKVNRLYESTEAFDEMMLMFYRHKGLEENASDAKNELPKARINIRYMRMFDGAFMYAGGYHVGIEYGSIAGVIQGKKNTDNKTGYFGWGISHEVGHQINQGNIVFAEVTNNVYALLAQTANDKDESRLEISNIYDKIYEKVTSHTLGRSQNVFTTLGMYWQLHLAYDDEKTFTDKNSIFTRINIESRHFDNSQKKYSKDDLLILFASLAASKDLTDYFATWGIVASDALKQEIADKNLEKETKEIYYLNDAARRYRLNNGEKISESVKLSAQVKDQDDANKRITLTFNVSGEDNKILGYEILRNGESIAFVSGDVHEFTDKIGSVNNRAFTYEVVAYDYLLNKTNKVILDEVKVEHDGSVKKDTFTIESNFKGIDEIVDYENAELDYSKLNVSKLIDNDYNTGFNGVERIKTLTSSNTKVDMTTDKNDAYIIINLNTKLSLSGLKYTGLVENGILNGNTIRKYRISVSSDKVNWTVAREGEFELVNDNHSETVYFMKENSSSQTQLWTYHDISYIKIESIGNKNGISGAEFDIIAPPGDNINFKGLDSNSSIGKLKDNYCYLTSGCDENKLDEDGNPVGIIQKGSVIIEGTYAGSPSFNVIKMTDAYDNNKIYSGYQLIFAEINSDLTVYEVSTGTWLYVMSEEEYNEMFKNSQSIRANLYRVSDALTFAGERLTSTSRKLDNLKPYSELSEITITDSKKN